MKTALEVALDKLASFETDDTMMSGEVEAPTGWFGKVIVTPESLKEDLAILKDELMDDYQEEINANPKQLIGNWLVVNDNLGFIHLESFASQELLDAAFEDRRVQYEEWLGGPVFEPDDNECEICGTTTADHTEEECYK